MQKLTRAEEQIMQAVWELEKGILKQIIEALPDPKPKQSTVSTLIKILENKGFVDHKAYGRTFEYFPIVSRDEYAKAYFGKFLDSYFGGSFKRMLSFFVQEQDLDLNTLDEVMGEVKTKNKEE